jgi:hypothetical protein
VNDHSPIRNENGKSFLPGFLYSLTVAFPSWAGILAITYTIGLLGLRPLQFLFRDLNH